ncbi:unnamed protein product, partial [Rhizoctonia solani]
TSTKVIMAPELSDDTFKLIAQMEELNRQLSKIDPGSDSLNLKQAAVLGSLAKCAVDGEQRRVPLVLLGENKTVRKSVIWMWRFVKTNVEEHDMYIATDPVWNYVHNLARLTGNLAVKCGNNQTWIARDCEPHMRYVVHFLTSWYYTEEIPDRSMAKAIARCLSNVVTENEETSRVIWTKYMSLPEKDNVITRLLQYPDRQTLIATLVFILNSLSTNPNQSLSTATKSGGRAICVSLLEMADRVYENDQENDMLQLIFNIFIQLFEGGGLTSLYQNLQSSVFSACRTLDAANGMHSGKMERYRLIKSHCSNSSTDMSIPNQQVIKITLSSPSSSQRLYLHFSRPQNPGLQSI